MVTPGTTFMARMDKAIRDWADDATQSGRIPATIVFDPCSNPGEGEVKIFKMLQHEIKAAAATASLPPAAAATGGAGTGTAASSSVAEAFSPGSCIVVGGDSDLLLLSLATCSVCTIRVATAGKPRAGDGSFKFSCEILASSMTSGGGYVTILVGSAAVAAVISHLVLT